MLEGLSNSMRSYASSFWKTAVTCTGCLLFMRGNLSALVYGEAGMGTTVFRGP